LALVQALSRYTNQLAELRDSQTSPTTENSRGILGPKQAAPEPTRHGVSREAQSVVGGA
jgi:hypothetical protein